LLDGPSQAGADYVMEPINGPSPSDLREEVDLSDAQPAELAAFAYGAVSIFLAIIFVKTGDESWRDQWAFVLTGAASILLGWRLRKWRRATDALLLVVLTVVSSICLFGLKVPLKVLATDVILLWPYWRAYQVLRPSSHD